MDEDVIREHLNNVKQPQGCPGCHSQIPFFETNEVGNFWCPVCGLLGRSALVIQIVKIPEGPAPEEVRKAWVGLKFLAEINQLEEPEADFTTGDMLFRGKTYMVPKDIALEVLEKKFPGAADWFRLNYPSRIKHLTFGSDEVELVTVMHIFDPQISNPILEN